MYGIYTYLPIEWNKQEREGRSRGDVPCMFTMRERHEVRAGSDERDTLARNLLEIIIAPSVLFRRRTHIPEPERLEFLSVGVDILITVDRRRMNTDFAAVGEMLTGWESDAVLGDDLFHDAAADEAPHSHALAEDAVEGDHAGEGFLGPFAAGGVEFGEDFRADVGEVGGEISGCGEVQNEVCECDG